jgi:hypothetical protein
MGIYEKMFAVMNESEAVEKSMTVGSGKNAYKAVSEAAMLNLVKPLFKKHKLIIFPIDGTIQDHVMTWDKTDYNGKTEKSLRAMTELKVMYRILDTESKEFQDVVGFGNGSDPQDKGAGKAFTYSLKNALSKSFMLFSGEDTDNEHSDDIGKKPQNPPQGNKPVGNVQGKPEPQQGGKNDSGANDKATKAQVAEVFKLGTEKKSQIPEFDIFKFLDEMLQSGRITTKYPYADKEKLKINWTQQDILTLITDLQLPF